MVTACEQITIVHRELADAAFTGGKAPGHAASHYPLSLDRNDGNHQLIPHCPSVFIWEPQFRKEMFGVFHRDCHAYLLIRVKPGREISATVPFSSNFSRLSHSNSKHTTATAGPKTFRQVHDGSDPRRLLQTSAYRVLESCPRARAALHLSLCRHRRHRPGPPRLGARGEHYDGHIRLQVSHHSDHFCAIQARHRVINHY